jgi:hypothetical protein
MYYLAVNRIVLMARHGVPSKTPHAQTILGYLKKLLHWIYKHRSDQRSYIRILIGMRILGSTEEGGSGKYHALGASKSLSASVKLMSGRGTPPNAGQTEYSSFGSGQTSSPKSLVSPRSLTRQQQLMLPLSLLNAASTSTSMGTGVGPDNVSNSTNANTSMSNASTPIAASGGGSGSSRNASPSGSKASPRGGTPATATEVVGADQKKGPRVETGADAADTKAHIAPLLDLVYCIIAGMSTASLSETSTPRTPTNTLYSASASVSTKSAALLTAVSSESTADVGHFADADECSPTFQSQLTLQMLISPMLDVLHDLLLPLHKPNEMVLWRDQVPVLQTYHEPLVRCLVKLVEKDRQWRAIHLSNSSMGQYGSTITKSVLVLAVEGILKCWPERYDTNTPKQVLLLHELEILLEKASPEEFSLVKGPFLVSIKFIVLLFLNHFN